MIPDQHWQLRDRYCSLGVDCLHGLILNTTTVIILCIVYKRLCHEFGCLAHTSALQNCQKLMFSDHEIRRFLNCRSGRALWTPFVKDGDLMADRPLLPGCT